MVLLTRMSVFFLLIVYFQVGFAAVRFSVVSIKSGCESALENSNVKKEKVSIFVYDDHYGELPIGLYSADVDLGSQALINGDMAVSDDFKGEGIGREMARRILETLPNIQRIESELRTDNFELFRIEFEQSNHVEAAVKATPFYKIWSKFGFTTIFIRSSPATEPLLVTLVRSDSR